jgi:nondiscriminating glutamyl-tRNA synthetase
MHHTAVRVRFAPAPTGMMHLGNIRSALINALYAKHYNGTLVLRIEDTDTDRNYDPHAEKIQADLDWLGLTFDESPQKGGPYGPYFQSERTSLYAHELQKLIDAKAVYRCFCDEALLERKRERQRALKLPPRYDRTCLHLDTADIERNLAHNAPFIWRFQLDHAHSISITDLAHKTMIFELKHFSDFPLTRTDGSTTFIFANCVDDIAMNISHVFRGQEHLSNTACQAALYQAFGKQLPIYWHLPLLCNTEGKKLSKRDFGFSLYDLRESGFSPEAILNYLAIVGSSYEQEIMSFDELVQTINLEHPNKTGYITYDVEKFRWITHQWIVRFTPEELYLRCLPSLTLAYPEQLDVTVCPTSLNPVLRKRIQHALQIAKSEMTLFPDSVPLLKYLFEPPMISKPEVYACIDESHVPHIVTVVTDTMPLLHDIPTYQSTQKRKAQELGIPTKLLYWFIRLALTGNTNGPAIHELAEVLGSDEMQRRLEKLLTTIAA